jgi:hypothetical protein
LELPVLNWEQSVEQILGGAFQTIPFDSGFILHRPTQTSLLNRKASCLVGFPVYGDVLAIPEGFKGKRLYNLLRPEV